MEAMRAAVANGADAVYFGLSDFNARHRATNFTLPELPGVMRYLHNHNVRGFVTLNTLIFSDELPRAAEFILALAEAGADAVIVQDLGVAALIHRLAPTLPIHGSTQMTLTEPRGLEFVRKLGVLRVVLARELSIDEIKRIRGESPMDVEVFVHGALCVAYSGQCLTSESLGGRSANRGQCAQACRLPYELVVDGDTRDLGDKAYLLSPQDLAAHDLIDTLTRLGVTSFKIEGRLKSAHYVAATTQAYRAALDAAIAGRPFTLDPRQAQDLQQSFSRGFTHGFLDGANHQRLVHARFPKSRGVRIGTVVARSEAFVTIEVEFTGGNVPLFPGDGVVFDEGHPEQDEQGGRVFMSRWASGNGERHIGPGQTPGTKSKTGARLPPASRDATPSLSTTNKRRLEITLARGDVNLAAIPLGSIVWKTDDPAMRKRLEHSFARDTVAKREPLDARVVARVGEPARVTVRDAAGREATIIGDSPLQAAIKHPLTVETIREQFGRLGDTPFELGGVELFDVDLAKPQASTGAMIPKSVLNDLRRRAVEKLLAMRETSERHAIAEPAALDRLREEARRAASTFTIDTRDSAAMSRTGERLFALVRNTEQLHAALAWRSQDDSAPPRLAMVYCDFEDIRQYKDAVAAAKSAGVPVGLATTRVVKANEDGLLRLIARYGPDAVLVRNLAALSYYRAETPAMPLIADYALNVANELTAALLAREGVIRMVPSYDLNWSQMAAMFGRFDARWFEAVIHQHMPMFHMEHCVFSHTLSDGTDYRTCGRPCESHRVELRDRVGQEHPLVADVGCRNTVFNAQAQSAADYLPKMKSLGLRGFRVELLLESAEETGHLLTRYARLIAGLDDPRSARRSLNVLSQLGVTAGTLDWD